MRYRLIISLAAVLALPVQAAQDGDWRATLERVSSGVVSIRVDGTRAFDTDWNQSSQATGFVIDAERGLLLTNRHVVMPGPVVAEAVFVNNEEVDLAPVYRDPVHDFGIFRYDPTDLQFIEPYEFELSPDRAQIGREIRVVGNDAGEQLSILSGTIAKLDRRAPDYGHGNYNDFNTFYLQAASGTSGGSSGSPVVDIEGHVVALNAGANQGAASSFFLPLDRVVRAVDLIQRGEPVLRGTLQTTFTQQPYGELRRLGLRHDTEALARKEAPQQTGMLVVAQIVPEGPADGVLEPGDILVRVNDGLVTEFVRLESILDDNVGEEISLYIERNGEPLVFNVVVSDLHTITPDNFLVFGDAVVHRLSYQQARHFNRPPRGIYVANPGYVLGTPAIPRGAVVTSVDRTPVDDLDALESVLTMLADGDRATLRYYTFEDPKNEVLRTVRMDRRWFPARRCERRDDLGTWQCRPLENSGKPTELAPATTSFPETGDERITALHPSLVMVNFDMPYSVSGVSDRYYHGTGLIVDAERGLVVVDRNTVPVALGDVRFTFAGSLEIPGRVEYMHPSHNLAVVSYDPSLIGDTPVREAELSLRPVEPGDTLWVAGLKGDHRVVIQSSEVASIDFVTFPLSRTMRFTDANIETIRLANAPQEIDGVLVDAKNRVVAMWSSFAYQGGTDLGQVNQGIPAELIAETVELAREGRTIRSLEVEYSPLPLASARGLGLSEEWAGKMESFDRKRRQVLQVERLVAGSPAAELLRPGDLVLAIDGKPVNHFRAAEQMVRDKEAVRVTVWRDGQELELNVATVPLDGGGVDRVLLWAGALLQEPHRAMAAQRGVEPVGVYVAYFGYGSPATRYGLWAGRRIVEVDGQPTPDLDAFLDAISDKKDREALLLKTVAWNNAVEVITLKLDLRYWPTYELTRDKTGWHRRDL
ncbi:MAG: trypsin-like peptidase domain-containing protein [Gammaproteobacteria bacterium]